ncbi:helix-turn-helix domain-containing protein [Plantactinospora sp. S1510]|uniref:Helix-turn-helix domain-containing protein n=1 Tax=Plantactinospora alkalitolerans TaxID=2789879 RepID=A0ABS0GVV7_9ACTN|nr:helix-turn-helix transcriptional regulator [Plantactinospora alkalitolerans]MBF9130050.1 helix-turn-helix domain-containing protein [Plantactinospora alkalitolerans]MBF9130074.1 helix-turn-helix domain-containing protein [Plantactinospora alkalitolerans]
MPNEQAFTLRAQWLGQQLREMRETAKLTLKEVGDFVKRNPSTVSRIESGMLPARVPEVLAYLDICGVDDRKRRDDLKTMSEDAWQKGWWDGFSSDVAASLIDWIWLESRAAEIYSFQVGVLPGLLQTRDYAEALIRAAHVDVGEEQIARFVELRMTRQQRLDGDDPVRLCAIIEEGALRRLVGGPEVMLAQLAHLREVARHRHVEILVLPADAGAHASPNGAFDVFRMRPPYPFAGCISTPAGTLVVEGDKAEALLQKYDRLRGVALQEKATLAFLADMEARLE